MVRQNAQLTFRDNAGAGRHGWLRLTPAYSYRLVAETLADQPRGVTVLDPFSGSGTTGLYAAEAGLRGVLVDINPFLIWLARAKTRNYAADELAGAADDARSVLKVAREAVGAEGLWHPPIANIERWWSTGALDALRALRAGLDGCKAGPATDLLLVAFCRTLIASSGAAFDHQSMSFKGPVPGQVTLELPVDEAAQVLDRFRAEAEHVLSTASPVLPGAVAVLRCDARSMDELGGGSVQSVYTSPPYANRMSYIRELRPYMYWLRYLSTAQEAGELDWHAIGGTWGAATARVGRWEPRSPLPLDASYDATLARIALSANRSADVLSRYVAKYFHDMWRHFMAAHRVLGEGGRAHYVVGNSTFFGHVVPTQDWYARLLVEAGFERVTVTRIRKRNSKAQLYEFVVRAWKA